MAQLTTTSSMAMLATEAPLDCGVGSNGLEQRMGVGPPPGLFI